MTFIELEYARDNEAPVRDELPTIRCSWCDAPVQLDGAELALSICTACYDEMLLEYQRIKQMNGNSPQRTLAA